MSVLVTLALTAHGDFWDLQYKKLSQVVFISLTAICCSSISRSSKFYNEAKGHIGSSNSSRDIYHHIALLRSQAQRDYFPCLSAVCSHGHWKQHLSIMRILSKNIWPRYHQLDVSSSLAIRGETKLVYNLQCVSITYARVNFNLSLFDCAQAWYLGNPHIWVVITAMVKADVIFHIVLKPTCMMQYMPILYVETNDKVGERLLSCLRGTCGQGFLSDKEEVLPLSAYAAWSQ